MADLAQLDDEVVDTALSTVDKALTQTASLDGPIPRDQIADQILRETLLTVFSDWPIMVKTQPPTMPATGLICTRTPP